MRNEFDDYNHSQFGNVHKKTDYALTAKNYGEWFHDCLPQDKNARMLDVGCGNGIFLHFLEMQGYQKIEGIDISLSQVTECKMHVACPVHVADVENWLKEHKREYDRIFLNDVLEHLDRQDVVSFLRLLSDGLAQGGKLIVSVPQAAGVVSSYARYMDFTHRRLFTDTSLQQVLQQAGYGHVHFLEHKLPWCWHPRSMIYRLLRFIYFKILRLAYTIEEPGMEPPSHFHYRIYAEVSLGS